MTAAEFSQTFGKLTRFRNEVCDILLDAPAMAQIAIAERILAEHPQGVAGHIYECQRRDQRDDRVLPDEEWPASTPPKPPEFVLAASHPVARPNHSELGGTLWRAFWRLLMV